MTPEKAKALANYTMQVIHDMDKTRNARDLKVMLSDWMEWAKANGVAPQIRQHMRDKCTAMCAEFQAGNKPVLTPKSRAMSGDVG